MTRKPKGAGSEIGLTRSVGGAVRRRSAPVNLVGLAQPSEQFALNAMPESANVPLVEPAPAIHA